MGKDTKVTAAIIGLGRWGQNLVNSAKADPENGLLFTHAMTRTKSKVVEYCIKNSLTLADSFEDILNNDAIEAVVLATPHSQHCNQIKAAAAAGKHVFVEKPYTLSLKDGIDAATACKDSGVKLAVGFNRRFLPAYNQLEELLVSEKLGMALHIEGNFSGSFGYNYTADMWRGSNEENPAGGMGAMGIHILDLMVHLLGTVKTVMAYSSRRVVTSLVDDTTTALIEFTSGATASLTTMTATSPTWKMHLYGSKGSAFLPNQHSLEVNVINTETEKTNFEIVDTLAIELDTFAQSVRGRCVYPVKISEALAGVSTMESIAKAAKTGTKTSVNSNFLGF